MHSLRKGKSGSSSVESLSRCKQGLDPRNTSIRLLQHLVFPQSQNLPSHRSQLACAPLVSLLIHHSFRAPVARIRYRRTSVAALRAAVPEASVDKNGELLSRKDDIRTARK